MFYFGTSKIQKNIGDFRRTLDENFFERFLFRRQPKTANIFDPCMQAHLPTAYFTLDTGCLFEVRKRAFIF